MTSGPRALTGFLAVICALVLAILGLCLGWPLWGWLALGAALLITLVLVFIPQPQPYGHIPLENTLNPDLPIETPQRQEYRVTDVALPSSLPDYAFLFSAIVRWVPDSADPPPFYDPAALAAHAVLLRARAFASRQDPRNSSLAQHQLNGVLGVMEPDSSGRVLAMAKDVRLVLSETDRQRLGKLSDVRKDEEVWEHERNYERSKRAYLTDDVLKDPGSAIVWWLAKNGEHVERTVERIGLLARLSAAAHNSDVVPPFQNLVQPEGFGESAWDGEDTGQPPDPTAQSLAEELMGWLALKPDDPTMRLLADRLAAFLRAAGKADEADEFADLFEPAADYPDASEGDPLI
ncbi:hypothetical protein [Streptomyces sp. NPDC049881]|uniref:hypothetical protein n=1 Tax=Streptomyces sp. NPDC049881 TaxID=3155778 RepID=UPI0034123B74